MPSRAEIVAKAREYIGSKFQHQGRLKGHALDCVGLPLGVADELGVVDRGGVRMKRTDNANYSSQPLDGFVHAECQRRLIEKPICDMKDGDLVTLRNPIVPCHTAFVSSIRGERYMIHANGERCVEHIMNMKWRRRIAGCFTLPGTTE
jgi:hypothetical protein